MIEPVTVTTRYDTPLFDPEDHRKIAAEQMGLDPGDLHCTDTGPDEFEEIKPNVFSQDGTVLQQRVVHYVRRSTWAERPRAQLPAEPPPPDPEVHPWPTIKLSRGARYHGLVTIDGMTAEKSFVSDGEKLVLADSPEAAAVLKALATEHEEHQAATGG